jgi:ribosome-interacting GTPase 1
MHANDSAEEMARTQKNKATEYHLGLLKAKLARYRAQLLEPTSKSGPAGVGFDVQVCKTGWSSRPFLTIFRKRETLG